MNFRKTITFESDSLRVIYRAVPKNYDGSIRWDVEIQVHDQSVWSGFCSMPEPTEEATVALVKLHETEIQEASKGGTARVRGLLRWPHTVNTYLDTIRIVNGVLKIGLRGAKDFVDAAESVGVPHVSRHDLARLNADMAERGMTSRFEIV